MGRIRAVKRLENDKDKRLYASDIPRLEKELNIEVNDFLELGLCACDQEDEKESNQDEDNSKLAVIDPWAIDDRIQQARQTKMIIEKLTFTVSNSQEEED